MKRTLMLGSVVLLLAGCRTPGHVWDGDPARLSVGMTKEEVYRKLGRPETVMPDGNAEVLGYTVDRPWWQTRKFHVKIVDGKVQSYEVLDR
jgi:hypothetical protein